MTLELDAQQLAAVDAPLDACVAVTGAAGTGKSTALRYRIERARAENKDAEPLAFDSHRGLDTFAFEILDATGMPARGIDDVEAELLFASACEPLFALQWEEFAARQLDPEVPGLRSPERFLESAFRLIRKLREAGIDPDAFLSRSLSGATDFYAKPPNFAAPALLAYTKRDYHDSLDVTGPELTRQYRREVDLAKILAKLYAAYVELVERKRLMTGRDAVAAATHALRSQTQLASALRRKHRFAFVDRAEDLTPAETFLLASIFGETLPGVTLCGEGTFPTATVRVELSHRHRPTPEVTLHRAQTVDEEANFVADRVREWLAGGIASR